MKKMNHGKRAIGQTKWIWLLFPGLLLLHAGCTQQIVDAIINDFAKSMGDMVVVKENDTTIPSVSLIFDHPVTKKRIVLKSGDAPMTVKIGINDYFYVVAVAEDPEGVRDIRIKGNTLTKCLSGNIASNTTGTLFQDYPDKAKPGENAFTRRWLPVLISGHYAVCPQSGFELVSYAKTIFAEGENFFGLVSQTPTVTFIVIP